jgi:hypothetical protein
MSFIRTKTVNGRVYRSLEERYREGGKVRSRYIRSLGTDYWNDRAANEPVGVHDAIVETMGRQQQQQDKTAADKSTGETPAADSGKENASDEGGEDSGAA